VVAPVPAAMGLVFFLLIPPRTKASAGRNQLKHRSLGPSFELAWNRRCTTMR